MKGKKKARKLSWTLKSILFTTGVVLAAFFLIAQSATFYTDAKKEIQNKIDELDDRSVAQLVNRVNLAMDEMIRFSANLSDHEVLKSLLVQFQRNHLNVLEHRRLKQELQNFLVSSSTFYNHIARIDVHVFDQVVTSSPYYALHSEQITASQTYRHALHSGQKVNMMTSEEYDLGPSPSDIVFTSFIDFSEGEPPALLTVHMNEGWFKALTGSELEVGIWSENGYWVWPSLLQQSMEDVIGDEIKIDGRLYKMHVRPLDRWNAFVVMFTDLEKVHAPLQKMRENVVLAMLISFAASLLLSNYISRKIALPVHRLARGGHTERKPSAEKRSFREMLLLYYVIVVSLPLLIYGFLYFATVSKIFVETAERSYRTNVAQTAEHINYFLHMNQRVGMNIAAYYVVQNMLSDPQFVLDKHLDEIHRMLDQSTAYLGLPGEIFIYNNNGESIVGNVRNDRQMNKEHLARMEMDRSEKKYWMSSGKDRHGNHSVEFYFKISGLKNLEPIGYVGIAYWEKSIRSLYREIISLNSVVELVNAEGIVFTSSMDYRIGAQAFPATAPLSETDYWLGHVYGTDKTVLFEQELLVPEWKLSASYPIRHLTSDSNRLITLIVIFLLASFICIVLLSYKISSLLYRSVAMMKQSIMQWTAFHDRPDFSSDVYINEIEMMGIRFNRMADKIEMLTKNMYESKLNEAEMQREKQELEMQALQAQINPHFLYNTLESVKWMIIGDEKEESVRVVENLGDLFRLGTSDSNELVSIDEEIRYTKLYINIQQIRFDRDLIVNWDIEPNVLRYPTVKLILQPIVENAIHHGMMHGHPLHIQVSVYGDEEHIYFSISDNGRGIPPDRLKSILSSLSQSKPIVGEHIGLRNVLRRIQLQFGHSYGLDLQSEWGRGTSVRLKIPRMDTSSLNGSDA